jgi:hypothetical protein
MFAKAGLGEIEETLRSKTKDTYAKDCEFKNVEKVVSDMAYIIVLQHCQRQADKHIEGKTLDWLLRQ